MIQEKPKILIVDDAPINIQVLNEVLQEECRIYFATNGTDAMSIARSIHPDLILLDIMMPEMDGYDVCRRIKAEPALKNIPVIFVTALARQENETAGLEIGGVDYIHKPFNPALLRLRVRNQLEMKRQRDLLENMNTVLEKKVQERTESLEATVRDLEAICYSISHDLRAPLRHINSFASMLAEKCAETLDDEAKAYLSRMGAAAVHMDKLMDALINLPRLSRREIHRESVDLSVLARDSFNRMRATDPARAVDILIPDKMVAQGDRSLLQMAMEQLLENAWKFSAGSEPSRITVGCERTAGQDVYYVRDNGVGFDVAYVDKLFSIFERLHHESEFSGLGIGLAMVKRIISSHGGEIWAEGAVGEGATFRFTLDAPRTHMISEGKA